MDFVEKQKRFLQHDNYKLHTAKVTKCLLEEFGWESFFIHNLLVPIKLLENVRVEKHFVEHDSGPATLKVRGKGFVQDGARSGKMPAALT
ncbi:hypothetical protein CDAR_557461 [Caerostris darwini]|uniref:Histone-lysine N-methyltransferase SETMAR n=1 Tax=Caerostris darwini TaxID=1538125 RepID=A0AAV4W0P6_9ARAC|nr:hypothetical protein CDAR_557461 [Caerostris darwini]